MVVEAKINKAQHEESRQKQPDALVPPRACQIYCSLRPEIFDGVKFRDEPQVGLPCFALVVLEEPQTPSVRRGEDICTHENTSSLKNKKQKKNKKRVYKSSQAGMNQFCHHSCAGNHVWLSFSTKLRKERGPSDKSK